MRTRSLAKISKRYSYNSFHSLTVRSEIKVMYKVNDPVEDKNAGDDNRNYEIFFFKIEVHTYKKR